MSWIPATNCLTRNAERFNFLVVVLDSPHFTAFWSSNTHKPRSLGAESFAQGLRWIFLPSRDTLTVKSYIDLMKQSWLHCERSWASLCVSSITLSHYQCRSELDLTCRCWLTLTRRKSHLLGKRRSSSRSLSIRRVKMAPMINRISAAVLLLALILIAISESSANPGQEQHDVNSVADAIRYLQDLESRHQFARPR